MLVGKERACLYHLTMSRSVSSMLCTDMMDKVTALFMTRQWSQHIWVFVSHRILRMIREKRMTASGILSFKPDNVGYGPNRGVLSLTIGVSHLFFTSPHLWKVLHNGIWQIFQAFKFNLQRLQFCSFSKLHRAQTFTYGTVIHLFVYSLWHDRC